MAQARTPRRGVCAPVRGRDAERCLSPIRSAERWELEAEASARRSLERRAAAPPVRDWTAMDTVGVVALLALVAVWVVPLLLLLLPL